MRVHYRCVISGWVFPICNWRRKNISRYSMTDDWDEVTCDRCKMWRGREYERVRP